jgi:hypothetical protein
MAAFDSDRRKLVVYGGSQANYSDLWEVDVATGLRTDRTTCAYVDVIPNPGSALVYDAGRRRVVLFSYDAASDVREWDPVADVWTARPAPASSGAVPDGDAQLALYDASSGHVLVFVSQIINFSETLSVWEWNGTTGAWSLLQGSFPMGYPLGLPSMAFDAGRGLIWGFGGSDTSGNPSDHLWTWNVATTELVDLTPATRPAAWPVARQAPGLAYDDSRGKLVLYGGIAGTQPRRDLWEWDPNGGAWTNRTPSGVSPTGGDLPAGVHWPSPDYWGANHLFADPADGRLALLQVVDFESTGASGAWLWDGQLGTWSEPAANTPPALWPASAGAHVATAWDDDEGALYLGIDGRLWRWTAAGGVWTALTWPGGMGAPNSLPSVDGAAIAYDAKARKLVMFGGYIEPTGSTPGSLTDELWLWDPATAQLSMAPHPTAAAWPEPRRDHAMAYDPVRQQVLLFGGGKPEASSELWALDTANATWNDLSGAAAASAAWPEARMGHGLVLDPDRQVLVLRGGSSSASSAAALDATWELAAGTTSWIERAPPPTSGTTGAPLAFVRGVGVLTLAPSTTVTYGYTLSRWDSVGAAWTSLAVDAPVLATSGLLGGLVGMRDRLLLLWAPVSDTTVPAEDAQFFHLWQWGATP